MAVLTASTKKLSMHGHATFVRPSVRMVSLTQEIVDAIMPFFPLACRVIGGYLADKQVGATKDATPWDRIRDRHKLLKQAKKDFRRICTVLGASLVFNEASHVHVEFAKGVKAPVAV